MVLPMILIIHSLLRDASNSFSISHPMIP